MTPASNLDPLGERMNRNVKRIGRVDFNGFLRLWLISASKWGMKEEKVKLFAD